MRSRMKALGAALLLGTTLGLAAPAAAQSGEVSVHAGAVEVPVNKSQVITADRPIARAMIGSEEIADIFPISDRSVYVLGKKLGTTSLTLYDRGNRVMAVMDIAVGPDVLGLRQQVKSLMPDERIDARISNESIVLSGTVRNPAAADRAVQLARAYAGDRVVNLMTLGSSQQVMLEVRFAEVSRTVGKDLTGRTAFLGKNHPWAGITGPNSNASGSFTLDANGTVSGSASAGVSSIASAFGIVGRTFNDIFGLSGVAVLDALEEKGLSKTLAEPTLIALSGEKASFLAGGEFPIPVVQNNGGGGGGGTQGITVEFKPFGVSLGFTPTVLSDSTINLLVEPEVSSIDPTASITLNGLSIPGLQTRRASTVLELRDGESFAIAGLLQQDFKTTVNQVPLLGSIPIIGSLFRSSDFQKGETELIIVVTPRLVQPIRPDQVRLPTDRVADPVQADVLLNGTAYRPVDNPTGSLPSAKGNERLDPTAPDGGSVPDETPAEALTDGDGYEY